MDGEWMGKEGWMTGGWSWMEGGNRGMGLGLGKARKRGRGRWSFGKRTIKWACLGVVFDLGLAMLFCPGLGG